MIKNNVKIAIAWTLKKIIRKNVIYNYKSHCSRKLGHALLYYKTEPFLNKYLVDSYTHTNNWEILEIAKVLNQLGYYVDIVDRNVDIKKFKPKHKYNLFIGIGAGNSGRYYSKIASQLPNATKIFYADGANPEISKRRMLNRYQQFSKRNNGKMLKLRRIPDKINIGLAMKYSDAIFLIGNQTTLNTYRKYNKPIFRIFPSTSPKIEADLEQLKKRDKKKFLYFGGNGALVKGLYLLIETFSQLKDLELYICSPLDEYDFFECYSNLISKSKNIHLIGFVKVAGKKFNEITSKCGFVILPSASEGTATSVVTCMRKGLIPVVTRECGLDIGDFGFIIKDIDIEALKKQILDISEISDTDFVERSIKTYIDSFKYTQANFSISFRKALLSTIKTLS